MTSEINTSSIHSGRRRTPYYWLCAFFLSMAYQKPIIELFPYERINPRLFDIVFVWGCILFVSQTRNARQKPLHYKPYLATTLWVVFVATIYSLVILPWQEAGRFSLLFAFRELQAFCLFAMAIRVPLTKQEKKSLICILPIMGIFTFAYCIPEYLNPRSSIRIVGETYVGIREGILTGPFARTTYFNLVMYSSMYSVIALSIAINVKRYSKLQFSMIAVTIVSALPSLYSGSRTGVLLLFVSVLALLFRTLFLRTSRKNSALLIMVIILGVAAILYWFAKSGDNVTLERHQERGGTENVAYRMSVTLRFGEMRYYYADLLPGIGAGYGVAPVVSEHDGESPRYRRGYGFHQSYLYFYEQGGIVLFLLLVVLLVRANQNLRRGFDSSSELEKSMAIGVWSYFLGTLISALVGVTPWWGINGAFFFYLIHLAGLRVAPPAHSVRPPSYYPGAEQDIAASSGQLKSCNAFERQHGVVAIR